MWGARGGRSKAEMLWTRNKKRCRRAGQKYYGMKRSEKDVAC